MLRPTTKRQKIRAGSQEYKAWQMGKQDYKHGKVVIVELEAGQTYDQVFKPEVKNGEMQVNEKMKPEVTTAEKWRDRIRANPRAAAMAEELKETAFNFFLVPLQIDNPKDTVKEWARLWQKNKVIAVWLRDQVCCQREGYDFIVNALEESYKTMIRMILYPTTTERMIEWLLRGLIKKRKEAIEQYRDFGVETHTYRYSNETYVKALTESPKEFIYRLAEVLYGEECQKRQDEIKEDLLTNFRMKNSAEEKEWLDKRAEEKQDEKNLQEAREAIEEGYKKDKKKVNNEDDKQERILKEKQHFEAMEKEKKKRVNKHYQVVTDRLYEDAEIDLEEAVNRLYEAQKEDVEEEEEEEEEVIVEPKTVKEKMPEETIRKKPYLDNYGNLDIPKAQEWVDETIKFHREENGNSKLGEAITLKLAIKLMREYEKKGYDRPFCVDYVELADDRAKKWVLEIVKDWEQQKWHIQDEAINISYYMTMLDSFNLHKEERSFLTYDDDTNTGYSRGIIDIKKADKYAEDIICETKQDNPELVEALEIRDQLRAIGVVEENRENYKNIPSGELESETWRENVVVFKDEHESNKNKQQKIKESVEIAIQRGIKRKKPTKAEKKASKLRRKKVVTVYNLNTE